ncbi:MAG TPA: hypothetical protein QF730_02065 [Planctomycetota bacterium]|nr:hypothetical protein [Planctomycetota bacterium]
MPPLPQHIPGKWLPRPVSESWDLDTPPQPPEGEGDDEWIICVELEEDEVDPASPSH